MRRCERRRIEGTIIPVSKPGARFVGLAVIGLSLCSSRASAQTYYRPNLQNPAAPSEYQQQYAQWYAYYYGRNRWQLEDEPYPVTIRTGVGFNTYLQGPIDTVVTTDLTVSLILKRRVWRETNLYLTPDVGWMMWLHVPGTAREPPEEADEWDNLNLHLGAAGLRIGYGALIGDVYAVARMLIGGGAGVGVGVQAGIGAQLLGGILGIELSYFWTHWQEEGSIHGVRFVGYFDLIRMFVAIYYL